MLLSGDKWQAARDRQWAIHEVSAYVLRSQIGWPTVLALHVPHLTEHPLCILGWVMPGTAWPTVPPLSQLSWRTEDSGTDGTRLVLSQLVATNKNDMLLPNLGGSTWALCYTQVKLRTLKQTGSSCTNYKVHPNNTKSWPTPQLIYWRCANTCLMDDINATTEGVRVIYVI